MIIWNIILANTKDFSDIKYFIRVVCLGISYNMFFDAIKQPKNISAASWYHILRWMPVNKKDILKLYLLNAVKYMGIGLLITLIVVLKFQNTDMLIYYMGLLIAYAGISGYGIIKLTGNNK